MTEIISQYEHNLNNTFEVYLSHLNIIQKIEHTLKLLV